MWPAIGHGCDVCFLSMSVAGLETRLLVAFTRSLEQATAEQNDNARHRGENRQTMDIKMSLTEIVSAIVKQSVSL